MVELVSVMVVVVMVARDKLVVVVVVVSLAEVVIVVFKSSLSALVTGVKSLLLAARASLLTSSKNLCSSSLSLFCLLFSSGLIAGDTDRHSGGRRFRADSISKPSLVLCGLTMAHGGLGESALTRPMTTLSTRPNSLNRRLRLSAFIVEGIFFTYNPLGLRLTALLGG